MKWLDSLLSKMILSNALIILKHKRTTCSCNAKINLPVMNRNGLYRCPHCKKLIPCEVKK